MKLAHWALGCLGGITVAIAADAGLFSVRMASQSEKGVGDHVVTFTEISRTATTSIIEMIYTPPRAFPDLGEVTTGMCMLLKAREAQLIQTKAVSAEPIRFEVSFSTPIPDMTPGKYVPNQIAAPMCDQWLSRFNGAQK